MKLRPGDRVEHTMSMERATVLQEPTALSYVVAPALAVKIEWDRERGAHNMAWVRDLRRISPLEELAECAE